MVVSYFCYSISKKTVITNENNVEDVIDKKRKTKGLEVLLNKKRIYVNEQPNEEK